MAHHDPYVVDANVLRAMGWTPELWQAAGHEYAPYSGTWRRSPYAPVGPPPSVTVAAAVPRPPSVNESAHALPSSAFSDSTTIAGMVLKRWLAPVESRRAPASKPLLVVGRSAWDGVHAVVSASAGSYPTNFKWMPAAELPRDATALTILRANATKPVIAVSLPSVAAAASFAPTVHRLREQMPQHSWVFLAPSPSPDGVPVLPGSVREAFTTLTWADARPELVAEVATSQQSCDAKRSSDALRLVEASFLRSGGQPHMGMRPETRLGLVSATYAELAAAANAEQSRRMAHHFAVLGAGEAFSNKRLRLNDFQRGAGIVSSSYDGAADFGPHTRA